MNIQTMIKAFCAVFCAILTKIFGGLDTVLLVLTALIIIDYITGVAAAAYAKELSSKTGFRGILKKICILSLVAAAHLIGVTVGVIELRSVVIGFYIANEGISIIENAASAGVPMPERLIDVLKQLKQKNI